MDTDHAVIILSSLSQETRLGIVRLLIQCGSEGMSAGMLATELKVAHNTLSFHLAQLHHAGLVTSRKQGRSIIYSANYQTMNALIAFLTDNCCVRSEVDSPDCMPRAAKAEESCTSAIYRGRKKSSSACC